MKEILSVLVGIVIGSLIMYIFLHKENDDLKYELLEAEKENETIVSDNSKLVKENARLNTQLSLKQGNNEPDFDDW